MKDVSTMAQYIIWAMEGRGKMPLADIYREVESQCKLHGRKLPNNFEAEIRQTLQACCKGSPQHNRRDDFFVWHERGYWSSKIASTDLDAL
jgi:hypothetical protein